MAHPQMFDDGDPYLVRIRQVALAFPDATEKVAHGRPTFRSQKVFVVYGGGTKGPARTRQRYDHSLLLLPDAGEKPALEEDPHYFLPAYYGPYGWIGWNLAAGATAPEQVDWAEVFELVDASYRALSSPDQVRRLDASELTPSAFAQRPPG